MTKLKLYGKDQLPGGLADKIPDNKFSLTNLLQGIKIELEHTNDPNLAKEIAKDHLSEDPNYYQKLKKVEEHKFILKNLKLKSILESMIEVNKLIDALKRDQAQEAESALSLLIQRASGKARPEEELGLTKDKFNDLQGSIRNKKLDIARDLLGVSKGKGALVSPDEKVDTRKINPFNMQPWRSGPVEEPNQPLTIKDFKIGDKVKILKPFLNRITKQIKIQSGQIGVVDYTEPDFIEVNFDGKIGTFYNLADKEFINSGKHISNLEKV